jgi:hypothetical protein
MQEYKSKDDLVAEINKTAALFIGEFDTISDADSTVRVDDVERTPCEMIAYQLGWMSLIRSWDEKELNGEDVQTPAPGFKWNRLGGLYQGFHEKYQDYPKHRLQIMFSDEVESFVQWFQNFSDDEVFESGGRKWASSTPSNWPIWKWVHINTVAPFKSFRNQIRRWKKLKRTDGN